MTRTGFEPVLPKETVLETVALNHSANESNGTPGGTRTRNLQIRSLSPYPLGHGGVKCYHHCDRKIKLKVWLRVLLLCDGITYTNTNQPYFNFLKN